MARYPSAAHLQTSSVRPRVCLPRGAPCVVRAPVVARSVQALRPPSCLSSREVPDVGVWHSQSSCRLLCRASAVRSQRDPSADVHLGKSLL